MARSVQGNAGFRGFDAKCAGGPALTIDMCPRSTPYDKKFFEAIADYAKAASKPVAVALALTGERMRQNPGELDEIRKIPGPLEKSGKIKLSWVNHSDSHPYTRGEPYERNFLTGQSPQQFQDNEVFKTEKMLIEKGLPPSVFFRFPGLMSTRDQASKLKDLGLVTLGTNAWLAMHGPEGKHHGTYSISGDQAAKPGRIILTHGNGGEPPGVELAIKYLEQMRQPGHTHGHLVSLEKALSCDVGAPTTQGSSSALPQPALAGR